MSTRTIRWGDDDVPVITRDWPVATGVVGYRKTYSLQPGQRWSEAPVSEKQYESLATSAGGPIPVGVAIASEMHDSAHADWALMVEFFASTATFVDHTALCVDHSAGPFASLLADMKAANGDSWAGFADVVGARGDAIVLREAKLSKGRDRLNDNQHHFLRAMRAAFGDRVDAAVVEWG